MARSDLLAGNRGLRNAHRGIFRPGHLQGQAHLSRVNYARGRRQKALVAAIGDDGTFQFPSVPVGTYKIGVLCPEPSVDAPAPARDPANKRQDMPGSAIDPNSAKRWFKIPARCGDPEQSGLRVDVAAPATTKEIELID